METEKALCLLQELSPSILLDNSGDVNLLLEGVRKMSGVEKTGGEGEVEAMETDDRSNDKQTKLLPQLYLLKLLSETDARKLPWTQQVSSLSFTKGKILPCKLYFSIKFQNLLQTCKPPRSRKNLKRWELSCSISFALPGLHDFNAWKMLMYQNVRFQCLEFH